MSKTLWEPTRQSNHCIQCKCKQNLVLNFRQLELEMQTHCVMFEWKPHNIAQELKSTAFHSFPVTLAEAPLSEMLLNLFSTLCMALDR